MSAQPAVDDRQVCTGTPHVPPWMEAAAIRNQMRGELKAALAVLVHAQQLADSAAMPVGGDLVRIGMQLVSALGKIPA